VAGTQWILGIRPTHQGLMIAPVIPDKWKGFKATRVFRGVRYAIEVKRQGKGNDVALTVDGKAIAGSVVPLPAAGTQNVKVEVLLGA
jgi:cellobiose phosphorylase